MLTFHKYYYDNTFSFSTKRVFNAMYNRVCIINYNHYCKRSMKLNLYVRKTFSGINAVQLE